LGFEAPQVRLLSKLSVLLQECDDGAAAKESLRAVGYEGHVAIRGGLSFTHGWRERN